MYEVAGRDNACLAPGGIQSCDILTMDNDYFMIDAHIDDATRHRILNFEYIEFSKLLSRNRVGDDDQRLEIINKNGMTFLSPVAE